METGRRLLVMAQDAACVFADNTATRAALLYVFDNPRRREHILLTDVEKDAKRERANQTPRELAVGLVLEFDARYRHWEAIGTRR